MFAVVSVLNSIPSDGSWRDLTLNQVLEDFGVFIFFMALWSGIYCHFRRTVDLTWLLIIFVVAIGQEEFNLWNKLWQQLCLLFGHEISSSERQRGDVFMMALVFGSLLVRFALGGFKSFFRIHITFFICVFVTFQGWIHFIFPYYIQQHLLNERLTYQKELTATYEGRFRFQCDHLPITCFEWVGDAVPITSIAKHVSTESITQVLQSVGNATTSLTGWLSVVDRGDVEVFRGVDANQKVLVTLYKNHELYRVVVDDDLLDVEFEEVAARGDQRGRRAAQRVLLAARRHLVQVHIVQPQRLAVGHDGLRKRLAVIEAEPVGPQERELAGGRLAPRRGLACARGRGDHLREIGPGAAHLAQERVECLEAVGMRRQSRQAHDGEREQQSVDHRCQSAMGPQSCTPRVSRHGTATGCRADRCW